ncbi:DUF3247 family protein [Luteimonas kalidii]|uniref:DUF3247 family protein n=1 Tax=Luteimonas kalidii TaxID=3042025 RepID=A0ABT6JY88_9GAMM|nr:DUF3247 family protein [Luteimonas kalidii]MDH5835653.1 DUF3247 family protein [Luteimonas kalidii]
MTRRAQRVCVEPGAIDRMTGLLPLLDEEAHVRVTLEDGRRISGVVLVKPGLQTFLDAAGNEGVNAVVKLDDVDGSGEARSYWLDTFVEVTRYAGTGTDDRIG